MLAVQRLFLTHNICSVHYTATAECWFQRLPTARGGTAQRKIFHLANWGQLIHPGPLLSRSSFFYEVDSVMRGNADSLHNRAADHRTRLRFTTSTVSPSR